MFIMIPNVLPAVASKVSFVTLLEVAEEDLGCENVICCIPSSTSEMYVEICCDLICRLLKLRMLFQGQPSSNVRIHGVSAYFAWQSTSADSIGVARKVCVSCL